jgi:hypothetical protein
MITAILSIFFTAMVIGFFIKRERVRNRERLKEYDNHIQVINKQFLLLVRIVEGSDDEDLLKSVLNNDMDFLNYSLKIAVMQEDYEVASIIRDQIKKKISECKNKNNEG